AASMGLPGFSGFIAELQVLIGAWKTFPVLAIIAALGIVIGVAYTLRAVVRAFFSDTQNSAPKSTEAHEPLVPITWPERAGAVLLLTCTIVVGLYPRVLLDVITPTFNSPLFERLWKGGM
ncbi:MAG: nuoM, partial [Verrucomicrobiales bacterium]|nr:nuoM [Verrucomicrobiales bacterium]